MNNTIKLSILICSLESRSEQLVELLSSLSKQMDLIDGNQVEVVVNVDSGGITTGAKRNILLQAAQGDYIAFVDDDDRVSVDYISRILKALESEPDCCGLEGEVTFRSTNVTKKFIHSLRYDSWFTKNGIYYRCPNHLSTVKRELAIQVGFPDITVGEDQDYSIRLKNLLKTEVYIEGTIYYYSAN